MPCKQFDLHVIMNRVVIAYGVAALWLHSPEIEYKGNHQRSPHANKLLGIGKVERKPLVQTFMKQKRSRSCIKDGCSHLDRCNFWVRRLTRLAPVHVWGPSFLQGHWGMPRKVHRWKREGQLPGSLSSTAHRAAGGKSRHRRPVCEHKNAMIEPER